MLSRRALISLTLGLILAPAALTGCSSSAASPTAGAATPAGTSAGTPASATASAAPSAASGAGLKIYHEGNAQVELIAAGGRRVLIDVWNSEALTSPATANDILLTTHSHSDHYISDYVDSFPGQKVTFETKNISLADVVITAIPSSHMGDEIAAEPTDYIFVIDIAGVRVAHFGDIGQDKLSADQLTKLGHVDVAISQLSNSFSDMSAGNKKGLNLMNQVKPLVFIPTHADQDSLQQAVDAWTAAGSTFTTKQITLTKAVLPTSTTMVVMGPNADSYGKTLNLKPCTW